MLEFRVLSESSIKVLEWGLPEVKVGNITDQCCYTVMYLEKTHNPLKIKYEVGKGGFLSKKNTDGYIYRDKMIEIFSLSYSRLIWSKFRFC